MGTLALARKVGRLGSDRYKDCSAGDCPCRQEFACIYAGGIRSRHCGRYSKESRCDSVFAGFEGGAKACPLVERLMQMARRDGNGVKVHVIQTPGSLPHCYTASHVGTC